MSVFNYRLQSDYSFLLLDVFGWENYSICSFEQLLVNTVNEALQSTYNAIVFKAYQVRRHFFLIISIFKYVICFFTFFLMFSLSRLKWKMKLST